MEKKALVQSIVEADKEKKEETEAAENDRFLDPVIAKPTDMEPTSAVQHIDPMIPTEVENDLVIEEVEDSIIDAADPSIPTSP